MSAIVTVLAPGLERLEPSTELGGILARKPGYHNSRDHLSRNDYSVGQFIADQQGPDWEGSAIDWTFPEAQRGDYGRISVYTRRLIAAGRAADPRTVYMRECFGNADDDREVEGYDFTKERNSSSDSSHLWHIHISVHRKYIEDVNAMLAILSVLKGETIEQWRNGGGVTPTPVIVGPDILVIDEELGPKTIAKWQRVMGTIVDGQISNPSELVKAVQRLLNVSVGAKLTVDGDGIRQDGKKYKTVAALQVHLGTEVDGRLTAPKSMAIGALQRRLNGGTFK